MTVPESPVRYASGGGVGRITLNRPAARNALSAALLVALLDTLRTAERDDTVRVLVITGAGSTFCAGADLKEDRATAKAAPPYAVVLDSIMNASKPVVAVVNGPARAGGLGLIAAADIAIAVDTATFAFPEVHIGVAPAIISVPCLARMNHRAIVRYALTAEVFNATSAVAAGLLTASAPAEDLVALERAVLDGLLAGAPSALSATKALFKDVPAMPTSAAFAYTTQMSTAFFDSAEAAEGRLAFQQKRPPSWRAGHGGPG